MEQRYSLSPQAQKRIKDYIKEKAEEEGLKPEEFKQLICEAATELILRQKSHSYKNRQVLNYAEVQSLIRQGILQQKSIPSFSQNCQLNISDIKDLIKYDGLRAKGCSYETLKRFLRGENVTEISFKAFCKVLKQPWTEAINQPLTGNFKRALLKLNHLQQGETFSQFTTMRSPRCDAALLIQNYGSDFLGLKWLLWYLLKDDAADYQDEDFVYFDLAGSFNWDMNSLWHRLKEKFGTAKDKDVSAIAKSLAKKLQKQHIVLVFYGVDNVDCSYLNKLLGEFWQPLLKAVERTSQAVERTPQAVERTPQSGYLLMCWINRKENHNDWQESFDKNCRICRLSVVKNFTPSDLEQWLKDEFVLNILKAKFAGWSEEIRQQLLEQTQDGKPESVLRAIYGSEWETQKYLWRKLD